MHRGVGKGAVPSLQDPGRMGDALVLGGGILVGSGACQRTVP